MFSFYLQKNTTICAAYFALQLLDVLEVSDSRDALVL